MTSAQQAEDLKIKEKRKREREVVIIPDLSSIILLIEEFLVEILAEYTFVCLLSRKICLERSVEN